MRSQRLYPMTVIGLMICMMGCDTCRADKKDNPTTSMKPEQKETNEAISRWGQLKYGMFIHYGMSTYTGREIDAGDKPSETYAPTKLDVEQWIRVARDAGMKYAVLTAKHVPGHCLWDSKVVWQGREYDYDVASSGDKTDVVAEFVKACKKYNIKPGLYWCLLDFRNNSVPQGLQWSAGKLPEDFYQFAQDQLAELLSRYPDIGYLWLDIPRAASTEQRTVLYDRIKKQKPDCVVLFNHGTVNPKAPITISDYQAAWPTDILNTERWPARPGWFEAVQRWKDKTYYLGYEHCDTICKNWFWHQDDKARPVRELYRLYKQTIAAGGNLLLNVPPDRTGRIADYYIQALMELKKAIDDPSVFPDPFTLNKSATASNIYHKEPQWRPMFALDCNPVTRWATDDGTKQAWLEVDLGESVTFNCANIQEAYAELKRIRAFQIEYMRDGKWEVCYRGTSIGIDLEVSFEPVKARLVRLNITEATDGPTITEFSLHYQKGK